MKSKKVSKLKKASVSNVQPSPSGLVTLLLKDHRAMKKLMKKIKSDRAEPKDIVANYKRLEDLVNSHVHAEEQALLYIIKDHPRFEDQALESLEEHRVHEYVFKGIKKLKDKERRIAQMKIYCELLEHHLEEEEEDLFPRFKKYAALSTRRKMGAKFLKTRKSTNRNSTKLGALKP